MYLKELIVVNYRSCKKVILDFSKDEPNVFIGINDCGKSSILKAAELLLGERAVFNFTKDSSARNDLSNTVLDKEDFNKIFEDFELPKIEYDGNQCIILSKLIIEEDDEISNESNYTNHLKWSIDQSEDNVFWYGKIFDAKAYSTNEVLICIDSKDVEKRELWNSNTPILNKLIKELQVTPDEIENENQKGRFSNIEKFSAIYNKLETEKYWTNYRPGRNDKEFFPVFRYLDWECSLEDINKIASDIMQSKLETYITPLKIKAKEAEKEAEKAINDDLKDLKNLIKGELPTIEGLKTKVFLNIRESITDIFVNKKNSDGDIHLDSQGDGLKRQIWFALIKTKAFENIDKEQTNKRFIWAFDEPETHLYPSAQRYFFDTLKKISKTNIQTLICTHSTVFIDKTRLTNIKNIFLDEIGYTEYALCKSIDQVFESLELRNSDFLFFNKFLVIEGDTEQHLLPGLYKFLYGKRLEENNIQLINLKGKNKWLEGKRALENVLKDFRKASEQVVYIFDSDAKHDIGDEAITENMFFVGIQDIEDSFANEVWVNAIKDYTKGKIEISIEEIEKIKEAIPNDAKAKGYEKFYKVLQKNLRQKLQKLSPDEDPINFDIMPSKGSEESELLIRHITEKNHIDESIIKAFEKLSN